MNFKDKITSLTIKSGLAIAVLFIVLAVPFQAHAYIGPGAGIAVAGSAFAMFTALLAGIFALVSYPIRYIIRWKRHRHVFARAKVRKFVILGLDGMDYRMTKRMLAEGKLPTLEKLSRTGCFKPLATTVPSISPVAWSSFQTGVNPGKHNIFDFLTRDRRTYGAKLSSTDIRGSSRLLKLGKYQLPLGSADIRLLRKGVPFWKILGDQGIFSSIIRVPITFPAEKFYGLQLSAMCAPDLRGTQGMFSYYTTAAKEEGQSTGGEYFHVEKKGDTIKGELVGPNNPLLKTATQLKCPFTVILNGSESADIKINGGVITLRKDEYSEWVKVKFKAAFGINISGICKFLLLSIQPEFKLYVTPINIDPEKPAMPLSHPPVFATYLSKRQGPYATLGLAEDSWALNEKLISDDAFLQQCLQADDEREKMFFDSLDKLQRGLCVCVFDGTDRVQHTFWRQLDKEHPAHNVQFQVPDSLAIEDIYKSADVLLGKTLQKCSDKDTMLLVISDHGF